MPTVETKLIELDVKTGSGKRGPWALSVFTDEAGAKYQTFDKATASKATALLHQPVLLDYEEETRGEFTNYVIQSIEATAFDTASPSPASVTPADLAKAQAPSEERQLQIMRQSALERAIYAFAAADLNPVEEQEALFLLADQYVEFFVRPAVAAAEVSN